MSVLLAILLALGVPFAQLQTVNTRVECCCPDPDHCKCPDHSPDGAQTSMGTCHKRTPAGMQSASLTAFVSPPLITVDVPAPRVLVVEHVIATPHAPPAPRRPDAPS